MVFSESVISILANDFTVYKEITFKGILDAVCSEHFIYLLQRGGNIFQYNIEDDEVIDLDCPIRIINPSTNQKRCLRLSFDCSLLTVSNGDSAHIINLLRCSNAIKINTNQDSSKVYGLRADYILLINQNQNEICFQLKDQDQYYEYTFPGQFESICVDEVSLVLYAMEINKCVLTCFDLRTPTKVLIFNELKMDSCYDLIQSIDLNSMILQNLSNSTLKNYKPENGEIIDIGEMSHFGIIHQIESFQSSFLVTKSNIFQVYLKLPKSESVRLQAVASTSSPMTKLKMIRRKSSNKKPEVKTILFQSKVKSSGYGVQSEPRKMFQPITNKKKIKPKKSSSLKVAEYNFARPNGQLRLKISDYLKDATPTWIQPTPSGKWLISEGLSISTFDPDNVQKSKTVSSEGSPILTFENSADGYMAVGTADSISCWSSKNVMKPFARFNHHGSEKIQNIQNGLSFISKLKNEISLLRFQIGEKSELDRSGAGNAISVYNMVRNCNEISSFCCLPSMTSISLTESNGEVVIFDLNTGQDAATNNQSNRRSHWMEQIDQNTFITLSPNGTGAFLCDIRDFQRVQRRFPFGPSAHKCTGSVSYDSQFLSYGSENHFVTFDLTDTRPIIIEKNSSPVYFTKFKSVSNQQICIDLDRNIFVYE